MPRKTDALEKYHGKRSAHRTPEPMGASRGERPRLFVVQQHAARRLHWDVRFELDGVLVSFAVPKGPSPDPAEKRLAVHVEDHPLDYADFEGQIPEGNYGAGKVIVWDKGSYQALLDMHEGLKNGKLLVEFFGYKLRGVFTLFKTKSDWLMQKKPDGFARTGEEGYAPPSVFSGLPVDEVGSETRRQALLEQVDKAPTRELHLADVEPMLAEPTDTPFSRKGWVFELKLDGYRLLAEKRGKHVHLRYRSGLDATHVFPELTAALAAWPADELILDGEVVVSDAEGRPTFQLLQNRVHVERGREAMALSVSAPATYYVFDLPYAEGRDLRKLPWTTRRAALESIATRLGPIRLVDAVPERGTDLFAAVGKLGLEGVVGKRADAPYQSGRSRDWQKVRVQQTSDFAICGYTLPAKSREGLGAVHLALWDGQGFVYAGRAGSGLSDKDLRTLQPRLAQDRRDTMTCGGTYKPTRNDVWVEPKLVAEVRFTERTSDGLLRQPVFLRLRDDKRPEECTLETQATHTDMPSDPAPPPKDSREVPFTNLDKLFWPSEGYTKGALIEYYRAIAPWLLPYLRDRPVVLTRYPDGIGGKSFFQKDAPGHVPDWLRTERMWSETAEREIDYFVCDDELSLLYIANMGTIPLHVWSSRIAALERPDWCILDFDPKGAPFSHVITLVRAAKDVCDELGLPCFAKTSGQAGMHVLVPLGGALTYEQSRTLAQLLASLIEAEHRDISTLERVVRRRAGKVYLDFLQNGHGRLLVAPFSVRPVPGAPVSMPLLWREVTPKLDPGAFTIATAPTRMKNLKEDPLRGVLDGRADVAAALARLAARAPRPK